VSAVARLRLRVTASAESILRSGHPWLFADSIREQNRDGEIGELGVVYDHRDSFLGVGLYDPTSSIRVRMLHVGKPQTINREWWSIRLEQALSQRRGLFEEQTTGFRWVNGESDGWPGLVLDRYDTTLVLKLYTAAWLPRLSEVLELIEQSLHPERVVLRLSRNIQATAAELFKKTDGELLRGAQLHSPIIFLESGLRFEADLLKGQKTGFFLDQRENRGKVRTLAKGRMVLNAFSFTGGFSLYAADGGATSVTNLDISAHALAGAMRNFALNESRPAVAACAHETIKGDALEWLGGNSKRNFDLIVLDPPSFAKRENEKSRAIAAYTRLASLAIQHLRPGGILVACSCSAHVNAGEFFEAVRKGAKCSKRKFRELETTGHAPDHPATFAEAEYLKAIYLAFDSSCLS
jgi:23S rRNA (cytosine1962-C5)-methyltransferase